MTESAPVRGKNILMDQEERAKLKARIAEITHYFRNIDDLRDGLKESIASISDASGLDKKIVRKMASTMYRANYDTLQEETRNFEEMYESIVEGKLRDDAE